jgi:multidrug resistance efflux pump
MKTTTNFFNQPLSAFTLGLICIFVFTGALQDLAPTPELKKDERNNADRIQQLEKRMTILETILFSSAKLDTQRAERLLADRKARLKNSRELFARGLITEFEIQQDRRQVNEAERELELATTKSRHNQLVSELELLDAQREFKFATEQLEFRRRMSTRGFATKEEVKRLQAIVDVADRKLKHAKTKLQAARDLEALKK